MTITTGISGIMFSSALDTVTLTTTSEAAEVTVTFAGETIYDEELTADSDGKITLYDFATMLKPYARQAIVGTLKVTATADDGNATATATIIYCAATMNETASSFTARHFLTLLDGPKLTAIGRYELLHAYGEDSVDVTAYYDDGTTGSHTASLLSSDGDLYTYDLSPANFTASGKTLLYYVAAAGSLSQRFDIDQANPDCAPMLLFLNSFGLEETAYCTGTHAVAPEFKYSNTYIEGNKRNYDIEETRTFKADTGVLTYPMAAWWNDVFRSDTVRILYLDTAGQVAVGRYVIVTSAKAEYTNDEAELPRLTFEYCYAQRNHNVLDRTRTGRIFDNTFDFTFA